MKTDDERFMRAALAEARKGQGKTSPNPAVGAVIVRSGRILARGWHRAAGLPHAEIEALEALRTSPRGTTLYVTLEPCSTTGRTPPCTAAIVEAGFSRVVWGATDPNPAHAGRAGRILQKAGIEVTSGVLEAECLSLNEAWNHWIVTGMPFLIAKSGMSLDGRVATPPGASRFITSAASRWDVMKLRANVDAILIGGATLRADNPRLTIRGIPDARQPMRVVWTRSGDLPADSRLFTDAFRERTLVIRGGTLPGLLKKLGRQGITSVLLEGGGELMGKAFDQRLVQKVVFYIAPQLLGGPIPSVGGLGVPDNASAIQLDRLEYRQVGDDLRVEGYPRWRKSD